MEQKGKTFNFDIELDAYCRSGQWHTIFTYSATCHSVFSLFLDVDILLKCCMKFRDQFMKTTPSPVDVFHSSITIASACSKVFRKNFLKPKTIGIIPIGMHYIMYSYKEQPQNKPDFQEATDAMKGKAKQPSNGSAILLSRYCTHMYSIILLVIL